MSLSNDSFESMFMCYEYLSGGCLADIILDKSRKINPLKVAVEIASGMSHLHQLNIMHRDLKPANIILDGNGCAKIADFGLSCRVSVGVELTPETGSYRWMAPEVIRHEQYSLAADVYSFGLLLWELYSRMRPFDDLTPIKAAYHVAMDNIRPPISQDIPPLVIMLIEQLWHKNAERRPTFMEVVSCIERLYDTEQLHS